MEVTREVLQIELGKLRTELKKTQTRIIQWVVGTFIGATIVAGTIIGVYT